MKLMVLSHIHTVYVLFCGPAIYVWKNYEHFPLKFLKIKKKSGSKAEILRNLGAQPKPLVSYKKMSVLLKN